MPGGSASSSGGASGSTKGVSGGLANNTSSTAVYAAAAAGTVLVGGAAALWAYNSYNSEEAVRKRRIASLLAGASAGSEVHTRACHTLAACLFVRRESLSQDFLEHLFASGELGGVDGLEAVVELLKSLEFVSDAGEDRYLAVNEGVYACLPQLLGVECESGESVAELSVIMGEKEPSEFMREIHTRVLTSFGAWLLEFDKDNARTFELGAQAARGLLYAWEAGKAIFGTKEDCRPSTTETDTSTHLPTRIESVVGVDVVVSALHAFQLYDPSALLALRLLVGDEEARMCEPGLSRSTLPPAYKSQLAHAYAHRLEESPELLVAYAEILGMLKEDREAFNVASDVLGKLTVMGDDVPHLALSAVCGKESRFDPILPPTLWPVAPPHTPETYHDLPDEDEIVIEKPLVPEIAVDLDGWNPLPVLPPPALSSVQESESELVARLLLVVSGCYDGYAYLEESAGVLAYAYRVAVMKGQDSPLAVRILAHRAVAVLAISETYAVALAKHAVKTADNYLPTRHPVRVDAYGALAMCLSGSGDGVEEAWMAVKECEKVFGGPHPAAILPMRQLAHHYVSLRDTQQADHFYTTVTDMITRVCGPDSLLVAIVLTYASLELWLHAKRHRHVYDYARRARDIADNKMDPYHPRRLRLTCMLALIGDDGAAASPYDSIITCAQCLAAHEAIQGPNHRDTSKACESVYTALLNAAESKAEKEMAGREGLVYIRRRLAYVERVSPLSMQHAHVLRAVASGEEARGQPERALLYAKAALDIALLNGGPVSRSAFTSFSQVGFLYSILDRIEESIEAKRAAVAVADLFFGPGSANTSLLLWSLGAKLRALGRNDEAVAAFKRAEVIREKTYGRNSMMTAMCTAAIARVKSVQDKHEEAVELFADALTRYPAAPNRDKASAYGHMGDSLVALKRLDEAIVAYEHALTERRELFGEVHRSVADSYYALGGALYDKGELLNDDDLLARAIDCHERSLDIRLKIYGERHRRVANSFNELGVCWKARGECAQAITYHMEALKIRREIFGERHRDVATSYNNLASSWRTHGSDEKAVEFFERALDIRLEVYGENHYWVARAYKRLGEANKRINPERAVELYREAVRVFAISLGEDSSETQRARSSLNRLLAKKERPSPGGSEVDGEGVSQ